jgi:hypothetical protein
MISLIQFLVSEGGYPTGASASGKGQLFAATLFQIDDRAQRQRRVRHRRRAGPGSDESVIVNLRRCCCLPRPETVPSAK